MGPTSPKGGTSYSSALKQGNNLDNSLLRKDHAVVILIEDDIPNEEYMLSLIEYVPGNAVLFSSRMSNNRLCVYLDSKKTVDNLVSKHEEILVKNKHVKIRRLINPSRKLLISNVCPIIPNSVIEETLIQKVGLKLTSSIAFVKAGYSDSRLQHVFSFRRTVFFTTENEDEIDKIYIPDSLVIEYDNEEYRIFFSTDKNMQCFLCKKNGHAAKKCPNVASLETPEINTHTGKKRGATSSTDLENDEITNANQITPLQVTNPKNAKHQTTEIITRTNTVGTKPIPKKPKTTNSENSSYTEQDMDIIKRRMQIIRETKAFNLPLPEDKLLELLISVKNSTNKIGDTKRYTEDIQGLLQLIEDIKPNVSRYTKKSLTAYTKHLKKEIDQELSDSLSEDTDMNIDP